MIDFCVKRIRETTTFLRRIPWEWTRWLTRSDKYDELLSCVNSPLKWALSLGYFFTSLSLVPDVSVCSHSVDGTATGLLSSLAEVDGIVFGAGNDKSITGRPKFSDSESDSEFAGSGIGFIKSTFTVPSRLLRKAEIFGNFVALRTFSLRAFRLAAPLECLLEL
jgi:hypothetical protein